MRRSAEAFDAGATEEAERLSSGIYIICHESRQQHSLLGQLGLKAEMTFTDSAARSVVPNEVYVGPPLLAMTKTEDGRIIFIAPLGKGRTRQVSFDDWYGAEVYLNIDGQSLSREKLVFYVRSQDGGAHVDSHRRDEGYHRFIKYGDHVTWSVDRTFAAGSVHQIDSGPVPWLTVRQIAWELDDSLRRIGL
ncbi:MAG: hypothetical protein EOR60_15000 [Mesorhizobium sp.]|nr:MAG: hypothetical protein EOR60_15000 [Mesorhizobium sp.]